MFVVIEWVDGAGKRTQTQKLKEYLEVMGKTVTTLSFPAYGHRSAVFVEKFLNGEFGDLKDIDPYIASSFYTMDRFAQKKIIEQKIAEYDYVISDRYSISNFIHRGAHYLEHNDEEGMNTFFSWLHDFEFTKAWLPYPDKIIFLSLSLENIFANIEKKKSEERAYIQSNDQKIDLAEQDRKHQEYSLLVGKEILPRFLENYHLIPCDNPEWWILSPDDICKKIAHIVLP